MNIIDVITNRLLLILNFRIIYNPSGHLISHFSICGKLVSFWRAAKADPERCHVAGNGFLGKIKKENAYAYQRLPY